MSIKNTLENEKKHESDLQYKMTHLYTYIYLGAMGVLLIAFMALASIDEKRFKGIIIALLVLFVLLTIAYLTAFAIIKKKIMANPQEKDGAKHPARIKISPKKFIDLLDIPARGNRRSGRRETACPELWKPLMRGYSLNAFGRP